MPKKEANFDLFIRDLLQEAGIEPTAQESSNAEIDAALKTASKSQTGAVGFPEYVALVDDFVFVVEDKADRTRLVLRDDDGTISQSVDATRDYAVNGALYYARKIAENSPFEKIFAFGCAGDARKHEIQPIFVDKGGNYRELSPIETFENFSKENLARYYRRNILNEEDVEQIELRDVLKKAQELHEYLRNYGGLTEQEKPLVVAALLLALREDGKENFIQSLSGDVMEIESDGKKIFERVSNCLKRAKVSPETKLERVLNQFAFIKVRPKLNEIVPSLGKTPLRFFIEFVDRNLFKIAVANHSEDLLGRYYDTFVSYTGGDGQSLGVVLTPSHITRLFCELVDLKPDDVVLDPCCGTGGFLVAAMNKMLRDAQTDAQRKHIRQNQLYGFEILDSMFSIATTNMILRGDGRSNLVCDDFFKQNPADLQLNGITVGLMNPPYSQAKSKETANLSELNFIERLLDSVTQDGRVAVIVPISTMIGKTKEDKLIKRDILKKHTLEGVISLNQNTFYQIGTVPCIAVFTTGNKHPKDKLCKFINFEDDGYEVKKHVGLVETERAKDRRRYLLDCWRGKNKEYPSNFLIETTVEPDDEWVYSFYYYNDDIPTDADFSKAIGDYLAFEFSMIVQDRGYLFEREKLETYRVAPSLDSVSWNTFSLVDLFDIKPGKRLTKAEMKPGNVPFLGASETNNGITAFVGNSNESEDSNVLGVNYNGSVVANFYHPYRCLFSDDVKRFKLKGREGNKYVYLFLKVAILQQKIKYSYGYKFNESRMNKQKILLPVDEFGKPDFDYMERYVKNVVARKYRQFLSYKEIG